MATTSFTPSSPRKHRITIPDLDRISDAGDAKWSLTKFVELISSPHRHIDSMPLKVTPKGLCGRCWKPIDGSAKLDDKTGTDYHATCFHRCFMCKKTIPDSKLSCRFYTVSICGGICEVKYKAAKKAMDLASYYIKERRPLEEAMQDCFSQGFGHVQQHKEHRGSGEEAWKPVMLRDISTVHVGRKTMTMKPADLVKLVCSEEGCDYESDCLLSLLQHMSYHRFFCPQCYEPLEKDLNILTKHQEDVHGKVIGIARVFQKMYGHDRNRKSRAEIEKLILSEMEKVSKNEDSLVQLKNSPFSKCSICKLECFKSKTELALHKFQHFELCSLCPLLFYSKTDSDSHARQCHRRLLDRFGKADVNAQDGKWHCSVKQCTSVKMNKDELGRHLFRHYHTCTTCWRLFVRKSDFMRHIELIHPRNRDRKGALSEPNKDSPERDVSIEEFIGREYALLPIDLFCNQPQEGSGTLHFMPAGSQTKIYKLNKTPEFWVATKVSGGSNSAQSRESFHTGLPGEEESDEEDYISANVAPFDARI